MQNIPEFFNGLKLNNYYKYLLYLAGIILILSLFLEVKGLDLDRVRQIAFWIVAVSLGVWFFEDVIQKINELVYNFYLRKSSICQSTMESYYKFTRGLVIFSLIFQTFVWIITFLILF